jgi:hypothetical protein
MLIGSCFREVVPEKMAAAMFVLSQIFEHQFGWQGKNKQE